MPARVKKASAKKISNRRARHDYELGDDLVVGLQLTGAETKALRTGHGQLQGAYVTVRDGELWLVNAKINSTAGITIAADQETRSRKLLAKKSEIEKLIATKQQGHTIVPLEVLTGGRFIKLVIAAGRGKRKYDKRETLKQRQHDREIARTKRV